MKLTDIIKTERQVKESGNSIENNIIKSIDVNIIAHFGNCCCIEIMCENLCVMSIYNNTGNLGYLIRALVELFDLSREDGIRLNSIKNIPCRLIFQGAGEWGSRCIGFGNFMKDEFVYTDDFVHIDK